MKKLLKKFLLLLMPESVFYSALQRYSLTRDVLIGKIRPYVTKLRCMLSLPPKKKRRKITFGFHLAEHCNLNCAHCAHFSPLAEKELMPVDVFKRDIERMAKLFNHDSDNISLLGGEPLLHPEIITILEIARKNFPSTRIYILSNGILLPKQSPRFWKACHDNNVEVHISHYDVGIDIPKIKELAAQYDVVFKCAYYPIKKFHTMHIDLSGARDGKKAFYECGVTNVLCLDMVNCIHAHLRLLFDTSTSFLGRISR